MNPVNPNELPAIFMLGDKLHEVCAFLDNQSLGRFSQTCKYAHQLGKRNIIKEIFIKNCGYEVRKGQTDALFKNVSKNWHIDKPFNKLAASKSIWKLDTMTYEGFTIFPQGLKVFKSNTDLQNKRPTIENELVRVFHYEENFAFFFGNNNTYIYDIENKFYKLVGPSKDTGIKEDECIGMFKFDKSDRAIFLLKKEDKYHLSLFDCESVRVLKSMDLSRVIPNQNPLNNPSFSHNQKIIVHKFLQLYPWQRY